MKLPFIIGTELTGIHKLYRNNIGMYNYEFDVRMQQIFNNVKKHLKQSHTPYHQMHEDDHCLEISSRKIYTTEEYKRFSVNVRKAMEDNFFYPKHNLAVCGGAHIHVGFPSGFPYVLEFKYRLARDLVMRPYLPWVFGEPDEKESMDVLINKKTMMDRYLLQLRNTDSYNQMIREGSMHNQERYLNALMLPFNRSTPYSRMGNGKSHMFRLCQSYRTVEFRFFEMTKTWEEQKLQFDFLIAYLKWQLRQHSKKMPMTEIKLMTHKELQLVKAKDAVDQFAELCYDIGVDFEDYKPFVKRNLYPRWQQGRVRQ